MPHTYRMLLLPAWACLFFLLSAAFAANAADLVSIRPLAFVHAALVPGEAVDVLLPNDRDMHDYALTVADMARLQKAQRVFWLGPVSEPFLVPLQQRSSGAAWVALSPDAGHAWLDPVRIGGVVDAMEGALEVGQPADQSAVAARSQSLKAAIEERFSQWQERLKPVAGQPFLLGHDAFVPFASRLGLHQAVVYRAGNDHGHVQAGMKELLAIQQRIASGEIHCALEEPEVSFAALSGRYPGLKKGWLDPLGSSVQPGANAYLEFIDANAHAFAECLAR